VSDSTSAGTKGKIDLPDDEGGVAPIVLVKGPLDVAKIMLLMTNTFSLRDMKIRVNWPCLHI